MTDHETEPRNAAASRAGRSSAWPPAAPRPSGSAAWPRSAGSTSAGDPGHRRAPRRPRRRTYPFTGAHQAGIVTPAQDRMYTAAFDLTTTSRDELIDLLRRWTTMSARLTAGLSAGPLGPAAARTTRRRTTPARRSTCRRPGLTITFGFGRSLFVGPDGRAGATGSASPTGCPPGLVALPHFPGDDLDPARSDGDLAGPGLRRRPAGRDARHPQPHPGRVRHRARPLVAARLRADVVDVDRPGHAAQPVRASRTARRTSRPRRPPTLEQHVWVQPGDDGPGAGSPAASYLVARRIRMHHRDLGPHVAARAGGHHRAHQGRGRAAVRRHRVHRAGLRARRAATARR